MGNSEVGHLNIGAGRIVYQDLTRISKSIRDGEFYDNETLVGAVRSESKRQKASSVWLLSDGGVHSHIEHLFAMLDLAKKEEMNEVYIHAFMDGRDVVAGQWKSSLQELSAKIEEVGVGKIATVSRSLLCDGP